MQTGQAIKLFQIMPVDASKI